MLPSIGLTIAPLSCCKHSVRYRRIALVANGDADTMRHDLIEYVPICDVPRTFRSTLNSIGTIARAIRESIVFVCTYGPLG